MNTKPAFGVAFLTAFLLFAFANPAAAEYGPARKVSAAQAPSCEGGFPDILGRCWKCPSGFKHDNILLTPDDHRVCKDDGGREKRTGILLSREEGGIGPICKKGWWNTPDNRCYTCPQGYKHDSGLTADRSGVCFREGQDRYSRAEPMQGNLFCKAGGFYDMIDGGSCWTCPSGMFRTAASVKNDRACTNKPEEFLSATPRESCHFTLNSIRSGERGMQEMLNYFENLIKPVEKPLKEELAKLENRIRVPNELHQWLSQMKDRVDPRILEYVVQLEEDMRTNGSKLHAMILDPKLMCDGTPREIEARLKGLIHLPPNLGARTGSRDNWFIGSAHAQVPISGTNSQPLAGGRGSSTPRPFIVLGIGATFTHPQYKSGWGVGFSVVSNFEGDGGIIFTTGPAMSMSPLGYGLVLMVYPDNTLSDFGSGPIPGVDLSIGRGQGVKNLLEGIKFAGPTMQMLLPKSLELSIDPTFSSYRNRRGGSIGFGVGWGGGSEVPQNGFSKWVELTGQTSWAFPIVMWDKNGTIY